MGVDRAASVAPWHVEVDRVEVAWKTGGVGDERDRRSGRDEAAGDWPDWLVRFDVRTVALGSGDGAGGHELRFWSSRSVDEVADHFRAVSGRDPEPDEHGRLIWKRRWRERGVDRLQTTVVLPAPGPGAPAAPTEAVSLVWLFDISAEVPERSTVGAGDGATGRPMPPAAGSGGWLGRLRDRVRRHR